MRGLTLGTSLYTKREIGGPYGGGMERANLSFLRKGGNITSEGRNKGRWKKSRKRREGSSGCKGKTS